MEDEDTRYELIAPLPEDVGEIDSLTIDLTDGRSVRYFDKVGGKDRVWGDILVFESREVLIE